MMGYRGPEHRIFCPIENCPLKEDVEKMFTDLYLGKDKDNPSITSRLLIAEQAIERFSKNSSKAVWLLVGTLVVGLANLIFGHMGK